MAYKPIRITPDVASIAARIGERAKDVEKIHRALLTAYKEKQSQMGQSDDLSMFAQKFDKLLDDIFAMGLAIDNFYQLVNSIQTVYGDAQERAIARAIMLPK